jgi:hypothetical protein
MRQELRVAARAAGDNLPDNECLSGMIRRWERGDNGLSERYRMHYCRAFGISHDEFTAALPAAESGPAPELSLEQLHEELTRLARDYVTGEPLSMFTRMRRVREVMYSALSRKLWLRDQVDLCFLIGCLHSLMADAAEALGGSDLAQELARAGLGYALAIDHKPLAAQLRLNLAITALWSGLPVRAGELAKAGLAYLPSGPNAAQLQLVGARSAARLGDTRTAMQLIDDARRTRDVDHADDLLAIGGEFGFSVASQHYFAGSALVELAGEESAAADELAKAGALPGRAAAGRASQRLLRADRSGGSGRRPDQVRAPRRGGRDGRARTRVPAQPPGGQPAQAPRTGPGRAGGPAVPGIGAGWRV